MVGIFGIIKIKLLTKMNPLPKRGSNSHKTSQSNEWDTTSSKSNEF